MHIEQPQELSGFLKKLKKAARRATAPLRHAVTKKVVRPLAHLTPGKAVQRAFTVPEAVRDKFHHEGLQSALSTWGKRELAPRIDRFQEGKTLITPIDIALLPTMFIPGGQVFSAAVEAAIATGAREQEKKDISRLAKKMLITEREADARYSILEKAVTTGQAPQYQETLSEWSERGGKVAAAPLKTLYTTKTGKITDNDLYDSLYIEIWEEPPPLIPVGREAEAAASFTPEAVVFRTEEMPFLKTTAGKVATIGGTALVTLIALKKAKVLK